MSPPGSLALLGSLAALGLAIGYIADYNAGGAAAARHRRVLDLRSGHPLQARGQRPERVPDRPDDAAVRRRDARLQPARHAAGAPDALFYFQLHARRVGRARRLPRPGPRAVRRLLRPDADPVLLPDRQLGPRPGEPRVQATIKLVIYTLVGSLLMLAGGDRHGRARRPAGRRRTSTSRSQLAAGAAAEHGLPGVDLPASSPPPSW